MIKRILSVLLSLCMICAVLVLPPVSAEEPLPFTDVPTNAWYYDEVLYSYKKNYIKGMTDNTFEPSGFATMVYDSEGNLTETLVKSGANRLEATYDELPQDLIDAFVAIEDARFWDHKGIDFRAIMRAVVGVLTNDPAGGGSTLTQQLIKNNVFAGGNEDTFGETLERKIQEWYLAIKLEKVMDKKIILKNYLNTINLGNNTLGVKAAAKRYFDKDVSELTLSEIFDYLENADKDAVKQML